MTRTQKIWLAIVAAQLLLVTYNGFNEIFNLPMPSDQHPAGRPIRWYAAMTGASNSYGFFKHVYNTCAVKFEMFDADAKSWKDVLSNADNHEADLRFQGSPFLIEDFGDDLPKSWAALMFGRHPTAQRVDVNIEQYNPVNMDEFRAGERPRWQRSYHKVFFRKDFVDKAVQEQQP